MSQENLEKKWEYLDDTDGYIIEIEPKKSDKDSNSPKESNAIKGNDNSKLTA